MSYESLNNLLANHTYTAREKAFAIQAMLNLQLFTWESEKYNSEMKISQLYNLVKKKNEVLVMLMNYPIDCLGQS